MDHPGQSYDSHTGSFSLCLSWRWYSKLGLLNVQYCFYTHRGDPWDYDFQPRRADVCGYCIDCAFSMFECGKRMSRYIKGTCIKEDYVAENPKADTTIY